MAGRLFDGTFQRWNAVIHPAHGEQAQAFEVQRLCFLFPAGCMTIALGEYGFEQ